MVAMAAALAGWPAPARADLPAVHLGPAACEGLDGMELRRLVSLELGAPLAIAPGSDTTLVSLACEPGSLVVRIDDPLTGKTLLRRLSPATAAPGTNGLPGSALRVEYDPRLVGAGHRGAAPCQLGGAAPALARAPGVPVARRDDPGPG
jgi:hypothetical protein